MNPYLFVIVAALLGRYLLNLLADRLNCRGLSETLPEEFQGYYSAEKYAQSQRYLREKTRFGNVEDTVATAALLAFILPGGFALVDRAARSLEYGPIVTGLMFTGILMLGLQLLALPFSVYETFVIEEKYGFNRTTPRTFALDALKALLLTVVLGAPVLAGALWFFGRYPELGWLYCWIGLCLVQLVLIVAAPYVILPLFNKFTPLEQGELRGAIETYVREQGFKMRGVFKMDGSKRSAKTNAFFTGFGRSRRIVLFDTLIARHSVAELLAVVAHEMGHHKKGHIPQALARSFARTGLLFFLLSLFIGNERLFHAFRVEQVSVHAGLVFFGLLYTPIALVIGVIENAISRRHEYQADAFAAESTGRPRAMIEALKKLTVDNLSNLTPHRLKVVLDYSHPPVLQRIAAIRGRADGD